MGIGGVRKRLHRREKKKERSRLNTAALGLLPFVGSFFLPPIVNMQVTNVIQLLIRSLEELSAGHLLHASVLLVLINTLRIVPTYLGALIIADYMARKTRAKSGNHEIYKRILNFVVPILIIPVVYMIIDLIYNVKYDFKMPAVLSICAVVGTLKISQIETTESLGKAALIAFQLIFGFQWLDIVPALTKLGFGHGELSYDVKIAAEVLGVSPMFNFFGLVGAGILILNGLISAKLIVDYHDRLRFAELERQRSLDLARMRSEALLARGHREMQALVHDLKTPLTTVQGLSSVMAALHRDEEVKTHAQRIMAAAERMNLMISEMMTESARRKIAGNEFAEQLASHLPEEKTLGLVKIHAEKQLPDVYINQVRLIRVVINLIDNALDSGASNVQVKFSTAEDRLHIDVRDDGAGMDQGALRRCWEGGYTTKSSTGLGLTFVRRVVEEHGGGVVIDSAPGEGTRCRISLPCIKGGKIHA